MRKNKRESQSRTPCRPVTGRLWCERNRLNAMSFKIESKSVYLSKAELVCLAEVYIFLLSILKYIAFLYATTSDLASFSTVSDRCTRKDALNINS